MAKRMHRAQILLEPEQHQALAQAARQEDRSISDVVRQIVAAWMADQEESNLWRRRMGALAELRLIRESVQRRYGVIQADLLAETRDDQEQEFDGILGEIE